MHNIVTAGIYFVCLFLLLCVHIACSNNVIILYSDQATELYTRFLHDILAGWSFRLPIYIISSERLRDRMTHSNTQLATHLSSTVNRHTVAVSQC